MSQGVQRLQREIMQIRNEPMMRVFPSQDNIFHLTAFLIGPGDSPYEGGVFEFKFDFPDSYPFAPPKVQFMTTNSGQTRFHPSKYSLIIVPLSVIFHISYVISYAITAPCDFYLTTSHVEMLAQTHTFETNSARLLRRWQGLPFDNWHLGWDSVESCEYA